MKVRIEDTKEACEGTARGTARGKKLVIACEDA